jgi:hypothetical protein
MENQTRYDLNAAVENWRNELAAQPNLTSDDRRELETHLRAAIAGFQQRGLNDEESFWLARKRVGQPPQLGEEFVKADPTRLGNPDMKLASTCHVERTNLSVRIFTRRFTRCTLGFSKKADNLKFAVALFAAHFNFCRVHSAHGQTPAQAAGLTDKVWTIKELLESAI